MGRMVERAYRANIESDLPENETFFDSVVIGLPCQALDGTERCPNYPLDRKVGKRIR